MNNYNRKGLPGFEFKGKSVGTVAAPLSEFCHNGGKVTTKTTVYDLKKKSFREQDYEYHYQGHRSE